MAQKAQKLAFDNGIVQLGDYLSTQPIGLSDSTKQLLALPNDKYSMDEKMKALVQKSSVNGGTPIALKEDDAENGKLYFETTKDKKTGKVTSFKVMKKINWGADEQQGVEIN